MIGVGPFSIQVAMVLAAAILAWLVARAAAWRAMPAVSPKAAGGVVIDALFWGALAARLAYIAQWWEEYAAAPRSMIAIGDGGFLWWVGVLTGVAYVGWRTRTCRELLRPALIGLFSGAAAWLIAGAMLALLLRSVPLPDLQLETLDAHPVALHAFQGQPVVLNLWATWCPPCRREMPVFEQAQKAFPDIAFVMVNQGEAAQRVRTFLEQEGLALDNVLLDHWSNAMQAMGSAGLPTTLFFDAQGQLVDSHLGEMTMASLKNTVSRHFVQPLQHRTDPS